MDLDKAQKLALETDYAIEAVGEEINTADAAAFFLEGYEYAQKQVKNNCDLHVVVESFYLQPKTKKMLETEAYINNHIKEHDKPPTYRQLMKHFGLKSVNTAYARTKHCRDKMSK